MNKTNGKRSPFFSIIVPVYNAGTTLDRCVGSILAQTVTDWELLLIDDGSTDGSGALCDQYASRDGRIRALHQANGGVSSARNEGLKHVTGELLTFCDADDWVDSDWLQTFVDAMDGADAVVTGFKCVQDGGENLVDVEEGVVEPSVSADRLSERAVFGYLWCKCFRMAVVREHGILFDERIRLLEDEEFICHYWQYARRTRLVNKHAYHYVAPSFNEKYAQIDNFHTFMALAERASHFTQAGSSITLRKYTMGVFRGMLLAYQQGECHTGWQRLKSVAALPKTLRRHNRYLKWVNKSNTLLWHPFLLLYARMKR